MSIKTITQKRLNYQLSQIFNTQEQVLVIQYSKSDFQKNIGYITDLFDENMISYNIFGEENCLLVFVPTLERVRQLKELIDQTYLEDLNHYFLYEDFEFSKNWLQISHDKHDHEVGFKGCQFAPNTYDFSLEKLLNSINDYRVEQKLFFSKENQSIKEISEITNEEFIDKLIHVSFENSSFFKNEENARTFFTQVFNNIEIEEFPYNFKNAKLSGMIIVKQLLAAIHQFRKKELEEDSEIRLATLSFFSEFIKKEKSDYIWKFDKNSELVSLINENATIKENNNVKFVDTNYFNIDSLINRNFFHSNNCYLHNLEDGKKKAYHFLMEVKEIISGFLLCKELCHSNKKLQDIAEKVYDSNISTRAILEELNDIFKSI